MKAGEPVIVSAGGCADDAAALADVLIVAPDGRPLGERCTELFRCYPGLAIVVLPYPSGAVGVGTRDGTMVAMAGASTVDLYSIAGVFYRCWSVRSA